LQHLRNIPAVDRVGTETKKRGPRFSFPRGGQQDEQWNPSLLRRPGPCGGYCSSKLTRNGAGGRKQKHWGVLAIISGKVIKESDLLVYLGPQLKQLKSQEYELKLHTLNNLINQRLLESEAKNTVSRRKRFFNRT